MVDSVGEQDQRLAAGLFAHEIAIVARQEDGIVQQGSAAGALATATTHGGPPAAHAPPSPSATAWIRVLLGILLRVLLGRLLLLALLCGGFEIIQSLFQQPAGRGDVLQQFHVEIEVNHEGHVLLGTQHLFEEAVAGRPLFFDQAALAPAGIDQQAERKRQIAFLGEIADLLGAAVLVEQKIVLGEVPDDGAVLVAHVGKQVDHLDVGGKCGLGLFLLLRAEQAEGRQEAEGGKQAAPRDGFVE